MAGSKVTPKSIIQIPTPKMVAEYEAVSPERCTEMLLMIQKELDRNSLYAFLGMALAFAVFLILMGCALWAAATGRVQAMYAFTGATAVGMFTSLLAARR